MEFSDEDCLLLLNNQFRIVHDSIDNGDLKQIKQNLNLFFKLLGKCNNLKSYNSQRMYNEFLNGLIDFDKDSDNLDENSFHDDDLIPDFEEDSESLASNDFEYANSDDDSTDLMSDSDEFVSYKSVSEENHNDDSKFGNYDNEPAICFESKDEKKKMK